MSANHTAGSPLQAFIDRMQLVRKQRWIIFLSFLVMVADGMDITAISHLFPRLIDEWGIGFPQVTLTVSLGVVAMGVGALISGPSADRWGRKPVILIGFILFNVMTAAMSLAPGFEALLAMRLIACIGLGGVMPVTLTIVADWVPTFRRAQMAAFVFSGVALGSIVGAYLAATLIPAFGWRVMILVAGLVPLIIAPFFAAVVPEPANTFVRRGRPEAARRSLARVAQEGVEQVDLTLQSETSAQKNAFGIVLSRPLLGTTLLVWLLAFVTQGLAQGIVQYLPTLLQQPNPGLDTGQSGSVVAMWGWGGLIGQMGASLLLKHFDRYLTGVGVALWAIVGVLILAVRDYEFPLLLVLLFLIGLAIPATPAITNGIATSIYPAFARATGVGTAGFAGRAGSFATGVTGGGLIAAGWGLQSIFAVMSAPLGVAVLVLLALRFRTRKRQRNEAAEGVLPT